MEPEFGPSISVCPFEGGGWVGFEDAVVFDRTGYFPDNVDVRNRWPVFETIQRENGYFLAVASK